MDKTTHYKTEHFPKYHWVQFLCWLSTAGYGASLKCIPRETPWRNLPFLCQQLWMGVGSRLGMVVNVHFLFEHWGSIWVGSVNAAMVSEFVCVAVLLCLKDSFLGSSSPSGSHDLSVSSSTFSPEPWREGFDRDIPRRIECSKVSYSLPIVQL